jgi:hypothetical protein
VGGGNVSKAQQQICLALTHVKSSEAVVICCDIIWYYKDEGCNMVELGSNPHASCVTSKLPRPWCEHTSPAIWTKTAMSTSVSSPCCWGAPIKSRHCRWWESAKSKYCLVSTKFQWSKTKVPKCIHEFQLACNCQQPHLVLLRNVIYFNKVWTAWPLAIR